MLRVQRVTIASHRLVSGEPPIKERSMTMRKRAGSVLFTAAAAAAIVGMSVGSALAATNLTVKVSHGGTYTASAKKTVLSDNGVAVTCVSKGKTPSSKGS